MEKRRPRGLKTREDVVQAALAVADEAGVEALTIRAVAERADLAPMSVYNRVESKEHLLDLVYQGMAQRLYVDGGHSTWQAELESLCRNVHATLLQHPNWVPLLARAAPPMSLPVRDRVLALMSEDGFGLDQAFFAVAQAILFSTGFVLVELTFRDGTGASSLTKRFEHLQSWAQQTSVDGPDGPTRAAVAKAHRFDLEQQFTEAVRVFIAGLETLRS